MKIKKHQERLLAVTIAIIGLLHLPTMSQSNSLDILQMQIERRFEQAYMLEVLSHLAVSWRVPIGIEWVQDKDLQTREAMYLENGAIRWKPGTINIQPGSLNDVLDSLIRQMPQYRWECVIGVINIYPVESRDRFLAKLMDTKIERFEFFVNDEKFAIRDAIYKIPEVQALSHSQDVPALKRYYSYRRAETIDKGRLVQLNNASFRDVLNSVIRNTENNLWGIRRTGWSLELFELNF
jgi:hypothetical protein